MTPEVKTTLHEIALDHSLGMYMQNAEGEFMRVNAESLADKLEKSAQSALQQFALGGWVPSDLIEPMLKMVKWVREHTNYFEDTYGANNFSRLGSKDMRIQDMLETALAHQKDNGDLR